MRLQRHIGAAGNTGIDPPANSVEYFGPEVACDAVPLSIGQLTQPAANQLSAGTYEFGSTYQDFTRASCVGGGVTLVDFGWTNAAEVLMGGPL